MVMFGVQKRAVQGHAFPLGAAVGSGVAVGLCWGQSSSGFAHSLRGCGGEALLRAHLGEQSCGALCRSCFPRC